MENQFVKQCIFLDRDGVLNHSEVVNGKPKAPQCREDFFLLPGIEQAVKEIKSAGFFIVVVTNQPDIGNGFVDSEEIELMHTELKDKLPIDDIFTCPHSQKAGCSCRKPKPGLLYKASKIYNLDLVSSWMVGDRWSDVYAGKSAGTQTVFIDRGYKENLDHNLSPDSTVKNLQAAVDYILHN